MLSKNLHLLGLYLKIKNTLVEFMFTLFFNIIDNSFISHLSAKEIRNGFNEGFLDMMTKVQVKVD